MHEITGENEDNFARYNSLQTILFLNDFYISVSISTLSLPAIGPIRFINRSYIDKIYNCITRALYIIDKYCLINEITD